MMKLQVTSAGAIKKRVEVLSDAFRISTTQTREIIGLINGDIDPEDFEAGRGRVSDCYNAPSDIDLILTVISSIVDGYGIEYIGSENDGYATRDLEGFEHVDTGDTYSPTIGYDHDRCAYVFTTVGDFVENIAK